MHLTEVEMGFFIVGSCHISLYFSHAPSKWNTVTCRDSGEREQCSVRKENAILISSKWTAFACYSTPV